ncbi:MINDY_DUB domain-containing protein [Psidium guajava]|nr:MINDY_DUB domain-containing protein [Psidium guajava]
MATSTASPPSSAPPSSSTVDEQPRQQDQQPQQQQQQQHQLQPPNATEKECIHKTKLIQFLGRSTPIVLQNDNGPCPLLAIYKDAGYVENQQQNIADAIDLLPRLATGIDVNIKFRRIDDLNSPVNVQSLICWTFHSIMVGLSIPRIMFLHSRLGPSHIMPLWRTSTAALGVPSPSLSKVSSFDGSPRSVSDTQTPRKGDLEETAELMRVLKLSETEGPGSSSNSFIAGNGTCNSSCFDEGSCPQKLYMQMHLVDYRILVELTISLVKLVWGSRSSILKDGCGRPHPSVQTCRNWKAAIQDDLIDLREVDTSVQVEKASVLSPVKLDGAMDESSSLYLRVNEKAEIPTSPFILGKLQHTDAAEPFTPSIDGSEPIYEGEECILESGTAASEDREPIYEGEVVLAKQADKAIIDAYNASSKDEMTPQQGESVRNFLKSSASQLTIYGLFCLQDGLKERELCVFFRNNHFSTMFKYEGQLYLLATDQGYINQPDLVWEKLNEVNGDTLFMTSNFKEFKVESHTNDTWDEHNAMTNTADYLASIDSATHAGLDMNSDLQLAIALQQQEFEQQQQQPQRSDVQQQSVGGSRLITGPQVGRYGGRNPSSSNRADAKSKDRCTIM